MSLVARKRASTLGRVLLLVAVAAVSACKSKEEKVSQAPEPPPEWGYGPDDGPALWASLKPEYALCGRGQRQSPIDLDGAVATDLPDLVFEYQPEALRVFNHGKTVGAELGLHSFIEMGGNVFDLEELHFHLPGEHTVRGQAYPAEMHLVHRDGFDHLAVVAVLLIEGAENRAYRALLDHLPEKVAEAPVEVPGTTLDLAGLLPADRLDIRYLGSLTTPPCTEGVRWFVLRSPVALSAAQLERLRSFVSGNNRPTQDRDRRLVEMDRGKD